MLVFPQLNTGALAQFPTEKRRQTRTVLAVAPDGTRWKLADPAGVLTEWQLAFSDLSDEEATALENFFVAAEGSLQSFTFVDPFGNLLAWSDQLDHTAWSKGPFLTLVAGVVDASDRSKAWRVTNSGSGSQALTQTLGIPPAYVYCLSLYVRAATPVQVTMILGGHRSSRLVGTTWSRITLTNQGGTADEPVLFGVELAAGTEVEVFGLQVEAQPAASGYQSTTTGGVYENARLREDSWSVTATGPNRNSSTVNIIHVKHS